MHLVRREEAYNDWKSSGLNRAEFARTRLHLYYEGESLPSRNTLYYHFRLIEADQSSVPQPQAESESVAEQAESCGDALPHADLESVPASRLVRVVRLSASQVRFSPQPRAAQLAAPSVRGGGTPMTLTLPGGARLEFRVESPELFAATLIRLASSSAP